MGKGKDLSEDVKHQIVTDRKLGRSLSETARLAGCSRAAVARICQQWSKEGSIRSRRQGVGRPRLIDKRGLRRLSRLVQSNSTATVAQVAENFNDGSGKNVSEYTVHRALLRMGLRSRRSVATPATLTPVHWQKRLQWAREHHGWTVEDWRKVAWSGESRFLLDRADKQVRVRRESAQDLAPACVVERRKADECCVRLWGVFSWDTLGGCICVDDGSTPVTYLNVVADHAHSFMSAAFPDGGGLFQQDSSPSPSVRDWFEEHEEEFKVLTWPPNSSDLNPINRLWDVLEERVRSLEDPPRNVTEMKDLLVTYWHQIPSDTFRGAAESMTGTVAAILEEACRVPTLHDVLAHQHSITSDCQATKDETSDDAQWLTNYALSLCQSSLLAGACGENLDLGAQTETALAWGGHEAASPN